MKSSELKEGDKFKIVGADGTIFYMGGDGHFHGPRNDYQYPMKQLNGLEVEIIKDES